MYNLAQKRNKQDKKENKFSGFTLLEMLISISLFTIVVTIAFTALLSILDVNEKAKTIKLVVNNLGMAMESMTREIRVGYQYTCDETSPSDSGNDCGDYDDPGTSIALKTSTGADVQYAFSNETIERTTDFGAPVDILGSDVVIESLKFYVHGSEPGDEIQPRVLIVLKGSVAHPNLNTEFNIQTTVSQRKLAP
jgi:prepilin-type N-terminal cleavage/methylation domain-containing protein